MDVPHTFILISVIHYALHVHNFL